MSLSNSMSMAKSADAHRRRWMQATGRPISTTSLFAHVGMITCIILQRFALPLGGSAQLSLSIPVFWLLTAWMLLSGRGRFALGQSLMFLLFISWALLSAVVALVYPDPRVGFSILSLLNLLFLYIPLNVRPAGDFDGIVVRDVFLFYARVCAVLGTAQYMLQFAHIRLFSFGTLVPSLNPFLLEREFATNSLTAYGSSVQRSNGFFLLEPSIFSQLLCLAILIEVFAINRWRYLPLYGLAYLVSFSGTGLLTLAITLIIVGLTSIRYSLRVFGIGLIVVLVACVGFFVLPDQFSHFTARFGELNSNQTSAYARYIAPIAQVQQFAEGSRMLVGYGAGSTMRSVYFTAGSGNPAAQLFIDYGFIGMLLFIGFLLASVWKFRNLAVSILLILMFELGGGYLLFGPYVLLMALLGIWMSASQPTLRRAEYSVRA
jgi:hypothetical protein